MNGIFAPASRAISETNFHFPQLTSVYRGKVRDVYTIGDACLVMIVTDRISAFDVVLPRAIPFKGQVLNQLASRMMHGTIDILPNWIADVPDPNVSIGWKCEPIRVEMVIRGYLSGHAWREYREGKRMLCGLQMPDGLRENDPFPEPMITPTTKASAGHDEDISREEILQSNLVSIDDYDQLEQYTRQLFKRGTEMAAQQGLILVDTKYEFGKKDGRITLMDEIHTPDSSRFFFQDGYTERQKKGEAQKQLSKEFVREWLIANNFQGKEGQVVPEMTDEWISRISERYIELFEKLTGDKFVPRQTATLESDIQAQVDRSLATIGYR